MNYIYEVEKSSNDLMVKNQNFRELSPNYFVQNKNVIVKTD